MTDEAIDSAHEQVQGMNAAHKPFALAVLRAIPSAVG